MCTNTFEEISFHNFATIYQKIAITRLANVTELQSMYQLIAKVKVPGVGFTKGLKSKICLKSKIKVLNVKKFVVKLRQNLCLDKMGFTKGLRKKFVLSFILTLRLLQGRLKSFLKYFIACLYILPFVMPTKIHCILWGSIFPIKMISVDYNRNLHGSISNKFPHFTSLWQKYCHKNG